MMIALNAKNKLKIMTSDYIEPEFGSRLRALWERTNGLWDECDALEAPYMCVYACSCENERVNRERSEKEINPVLDGIG
nr:reverse transcriptase, RNA-dependent DNA polymerase, Gag-polypeptide of LTR copia-type [Tanacetum cinerariifolium]